MDKRTFGRAGWKVAPIGFGAWAIGADWGDVSERDAEAALNEALDRGVTFIDTADVYGVGRSEKLIARVLKSRNAKDVIVATKAGKQINPHVNAGYKTALLDRFVEDSIKRLGVEALDLVQLHSPPHEVYYRPEIFEGMDRLVKAGKIKAYGVSVEWIEEAIKALEYPIGSVQIIFNMFRQRPAEMFFDLAKKKGVGIIARVPLASGLLSGKFTAGTKFAADDHRTYNRNGEAFDKGETFSGIPYDVGLQAVEELRPLVPGGVTMAQWALRWILMFDAVTVAIPGAKNRDQAAGNAAAMNLPPLTEAEMAAVKRIYDSRIRTHVHQRW
jgi:aryl-alcohol dehydrogenase-like predicted oxidoreductase